MQVEGRGGEKAPENRQIPRKIPKESHRTSKRLREWQQNPKESQKNPRCNSTEYPNRIGIPQESSSKKAVENPNN